MNQAFIYLASQSPRRRELLAQLGIAHRVHAIAIDESRKIGERSPQLVVRLARAKAAAAAATLGRTIPVLAADTVVDIDDETLGKPAGRAEGIAMLLRLAGRSHSVLTAVATIDARRTRTALSETTVWFREIDESEAAAYWDSGEPADKAGAYAIQGTGAIFVQRIVGSYSGVMGLPLFETAGLLRESGIEVLGGQAA